MPSRGISLVSIHPNPADPLGLDLKELLAALGMRVSRWIWCVKDLDAAGPRAEALCQRAREAGGPGLWINSAELTQEAQGITQTIEGQLLAFPVGIDAAAVGPRELSLSAFPSSRAELAIEAIDGAFFDVYTKDPDDLAALGRFSDVRREDPAAYLFTP